MKESRMRKVGKNTIMALALNCTNILLQFFSRVIFVRILSSDYLGINGLFTNILNVLSLADLGMQTVMMYRLYKPIADSDEKKIVDLVAYFKKIYNIIAVVVFCIGILFVPFLKFIINLDTYIPYLEVYYVIALINVVLSYLFVYRTTLIVADQKYYILNVYIIIFKVITFFAQTIILVFFANYLFYLLVGMIFTLLCNLYQNKIAIKMYPYLKKLNTKNIVDINRKTIRNDINDMFLYKVCGIIQNNTDNILISLFIGTVYVGFYSNYILIVNAIISILTMIFASVKAGVGNIVAIDSQTKQTEGLFWRLEFINFWMVAFSAICFICLFSDFISLAFGSSYLLPQIVVVAIVLNFYTNHIRQVIWTYRETTGIFHETKYITLVTAILNIFFSLFGGYYGGLFGIVFATVIARMLYAWWKEPMILFNKYFNKSAKTYYITYIRRFCLFLVSCLITYYLCNVYTDSIMIYGFIYKIIICCIVPNIIFLLYFRKTDEFSYFLNKIVKPIMVMIFKK